MTVPGGDAGIELVTVRDVELVKEGEWPAVTGPAKVTAEMLQSMAAAASSGAFEHAPIKIGHFDPRFNTPNRAKFDGDPALGWIENVRVAGKSLVADLGRVPKNFAELLKSAYRKRSIEWEENVDGTDGRKYPAVLKALAVLGANEPAVTGLRDVVSIFAAALDVGDETDRDVKVAFLGDDSAEIAQCLSRLSELMHAPGGESGNSGFLDLGGDTVADLDEARVRELLDLSAEADVEAELERLKTLRSEKGTGDGGDADKGAKTDDDKSGDKGTGDNADDDDKSKGEPADAGDKTEEVTVSKAVIEELQRQAALGVQAHQQLNETNVDTELKAAAKAGKIAPTEFSVIREQLLNPATAEGARKMLTARPAVLPTVAIGDASSDTSSADETAFVNFASSIFGDDLATIGRRETK